MHTVICIIILNTHFTVTLQNYPYVLRVLQKENANSSLLGTMLGVGKVSVPVAQISCADYLSTVLEKWENGKRKDYEYTWEVLKSALNGCDHGALVQKIEKEGRNGPSKTLNCLLTNRLFFLLQ